MNPGGPGGSGVEFLPQVLFAIDSSISDRFDLVSFDPRGVGESDPIVCLTDQQKDAYAAFDAVPTPAEIPTLEDLNKQFGASCKAKYGDELSHFGTVDAARDMDRIREAVGDDKLTYLGFSYGTRLGSVYAQLFPDKVRALALDGAVDPDPAATDFPAKQAEGFEQAFDAFAKDCDANPQCPAGPDAAGLYDQLLKQVDTKPIPAAHDSRVLTQGYLVSGAISALYAKELWSPLATGLRQAQQGDGSLLLQLADSLSGRANDGTWNNQWDINTAVNCLDDPERDTTSQVESLATDLEKTSPRFGAVIGWTNLTCTYWPVPPDPIPVATADGAPPIVVVGTTRDPATPYVWAERMASTLEVRRAHHPRRRRSHGLHREPVRRADGERLPDQPHGAARQGVLRELALSRRGGLRGLLGGEPSPELGRRRLVRRHVVRLRVDLVELDRARQHAALPLLVLALALVEVRHDLGREHLEALADVGMRVLPRLVEQDHLVDVRLLELREAVCARCRPSR